MRYKILYLPTGAFLKRITYRNYRNYILSDEELIFNSSIYELLAQDLKKEYPDWCRLNEIIFPVLKEHFEIIKV